MKKKWLLLAPLAILAVLAIALFFIDNSAQKKLENALAEARKAGLATKPDDLRKRELQPGENAAEEYRKAIANVALVSKGDKDLLANYSPGRPLAKQEAQFKKLAIPGKVDAARIERALKGYAPVFAHLQNGAKKPHLDWDRRWEQGLALMYPEFAEVKSLVKVLMIDAERAAGHRDYAVLRARIAQGRRMAEHIGEDPTMIALLVSIALHSIVSVQSGSIAYKFRDDPSAVAAIREELKRKPVIPSVKWAMNGEMVAAQLAFVDIEKNLPSVTEEFATFGGDEEMKQFKSDARWLRLPWFRRQVQEMVVTRYTTAYKSLPDNPEDRASVEKVLDTLDKEFSNQDDRPNRLASIFAPAFGQIGEALVNVDLYRRQTLMATYVMDAFRTSGKWPAALPSVPENLDPYSGKPFRYRVLPAGFVIYSVGVDGKDDGGDTSKTVDKMLGLINGEFVRRGR